MPRTPKDVLPSGITRAPQPKRITRKIKVAINAPVPILAIAANLNYAIRTAEAEGAQTKTHPRPLNSKINAHDSASVNCGSSAQKIAGAGSSQFARRYGMPLKDKSVHFLSDGNTGL